MHIDETMYEKVCDIDNLYDAFLHISQVSAWKEETQRYKLWLMPNLCDLKKSLVEHTYAPKIPRGFITYERGKPRYIESRTVNDRIVQRVVHDQIIKPVIYPLLIYDNAASIEDRGTDFFRSRLLRHLSWFASQYGTDGYILLIDFKKFFDNIRHADFLQMLAPLIPDPDAFNLVAMLINSNAIDVSYMSDTEYANCMNVPFNNIEYRLALQDGVIHATGQKFMHKSMGIGSQISQDAGLFYPHEIDNWVKIVCGVIGYGRYMDDSYLIERYKDRIWWLFGGIQQICANRGIFINERKTQVVSLKHEFTILQTKYKLHDNGDVTIIPNSDTFKRERKKLNKQAENLEIGATRITFDDIQNGYDSWRGNILKRSNGKYVKSLETMDNHFNDLFIDPFIKH